MRATRERALDGDLALALRDHAAARLAMASPTMDIENALSWTSSSATG